MPDGRTALPAKPVTNQPAFFAQRSGPMFDITVLCEDGGIYHAWWDGTTWHGYENLAQPG